MKELVQEGDHSLHLLRHCHWCRPCERPGILAGTSYGGPTT